MPQAWQAVDMDYWHSFLVSYIEAKKLMSYFYFSVQWPNNVKLLNLWTLILLEFKKIPNNCVSDSIDSAFSILLCFTKALMQNMFITLKTKLFSTVYLYTQHNRCRWNFSQSENIEQFLVVDDENYIQETLFKATLPIFSVIPYLLYWIFKDGQSWVSGHLVWFSFCKTRLTYSQGNESTSSPDGNVAWA